MILPYHSPPCMLLYSKRKCGLSAFEHIAKAFRIMDAPGSEDGGQGGKGKGKRLSPRQDGGRSRIDTSPTTAASTRLGVPEESSPPTPRQSGT